MTSQQARPTGGPHNVQIGLPGKVIRIKEIPVLKNGGSTMDHSNIFPNPHNPFESPSLSAYSTNDSDHSGTSEQDEFHLEKYESNSRYHHLRQVSRSTNADEKDKKPDLNLITDFSTPKMPMKSQAVAVHEVHVKQAHADRLRKAISVVSHKAVQSAVSPANGSNESPKSTTTGQNPLRLISQLGKKQKIKQYKYPGVIKKQSSPTNQRIPIGIMIPKRDAELIRQNEINSALPSITPRTPAIIVTPAENQSSWVYHNQGAELTDSPQNEKQQVLYHVNEVNLSANEESDRPKSQGWWNLMLSPLLRAGSISSRKGQQNGDTSPIPPVPVMSEKDCSPMLSAGSDPSFLVSSCKTSPDTPRRQGLASVRDSTWSRWTEWENERDMANREATPEQNDHDAPCEQDLTTLPATATVGLAAEYFHACAVEQATGRPYFDCVNHSCAEKLPKLKSIHDNVSRPMVMLGSPFQSPLINVVSVANAGENKDWVNYRSPVDGETNLSPDELSPNVRQASTASVMRAKTLDILEHKGTANKSMVEGDKASPLSSISPPVTDSATNTYSAPQHNDTLPSIVSVVPPPQTRTKTIRDHATDAIDPPKKMITSEKSPAIVTDHIPLPSYPMAGSKGNPMIDDLKKGADPASTIPSSSSKSQLPDRPAFITAETEYPELPGRAPTAPVTAAALAQSGQRLRKEQRRRRYEKEDAAATKVGGLWRGRGCFSNNGCMGRGGPERRTKRRWILILSLLILAIMITSIVLAVTLTRRGDHTPVQSQWLNLTGYPPMPTGILTIAAPKLVAQQKECVKPTTMWSCSVPKEDRAALGTNESNQPNLRFEIRFRNGTVPANMTIPISGQPTTSGSTSRDPFTNDLFVANPAAPNQPDQVFLGQTTDNTTTPFDGEITPFYITFMPTYPLIPPGFDSSASRLLSRRATNPLIAAIPAAARADDGSAAPASLLPTTPYMISQPIRLYNRGLPDEHYGFYNYYDKSIYLSGVQTENGTLSNGSVQVVEADQDGGCTKSQAKVTCTFAQTRFLFQIFTQDTFPATLLASNVRTNTTHPDDIKQESLTSSATNFDTPGSFPYPTSIKVDRHGGDIDEKMIYCYGMDGGQISDSIGMLAPEFRSTGGTLVNPAPSIVADQNKLNTTAGGIDGGTGGCSCNWQNWQ